MDYLIKSIGDIREPYANEQGAKDYCLEHMAKLKTMYDALVEAKYQNAAYILSYERAEESLNFAHKQYSDGYDKLDTEIEDDSGKKAAVLKEMYKNVRDIEKILRAVTSKIEELYDVDKGIEEALKEVISKNNTLNSINNQNSLIMYPPVNINGYWGH